MGLMDPSRVRTVPSFVCAELSGLSVPQVARSDAEVGRAHEADRMARFERTHRRRAQGAELKSMDDLVPLLARRGITATVSNPMNRPDQHHMPVPQRRDASPVQRQGSTALASP